MRKGMLLLAGMMFVAMPAASAFAAGPNSGGGGVSTATTNTPGAGDPADVLGVSGHNAVDPGRAMHIAGEAGIGYMTGDPFGASGILNNGSAILGAPTYTEPCPTTYDGFTGCTAHTNATDPQTAGLAGTDVPIVDDLLAKMRDFTSAKEHTVQTLDTLFYLDQKTGATNGFYVNQTLDQDLASMTGAVSSYFSAGNGTKQHLVSVWIMGNAVNKATTPSSANNGITDADTMDQWLMSYTKDVDASGNGIVSSIDSWVALDRNHDSGCPGGGAGSCGSHAIGGGHTPFTHTGTNIDGHPASN